MSSDTERVHRWLTQAELDAMLDQAFTEGANAMCESVVKTVCDEQRVWLMESEIVFAIRKAKIPTRKP